MAGTAFYASPIESVMGQLFEGAPQFRGPKPRGAGRARLSKAHQMARAATGRPSAVAKLIRSGGTRDRAGLKGQLEYVFTKSEAIVDPAALYSDQAVLSNADMNRITREWEVSWNSRTFAGNTSHVLLSYPIGTAAEKVAAITDDVCNELLSSGAQTFDFVAGIHTDREHPHAHLIINRFPNEGGPLFTFRRGAEISYESFRESMVAHGERHGVLMQATSRFERGIVERAPSTKEVYAARDEGRAIEPRPHDQIHEDYARLAINNAAGLYAALSVVSDTQRVQPILDACSRSSEVLRQGFSIRSEVPAKQTRKGNETEALDQVLTTLSGNLERLRVAIEMAEPALRPALEKDYASIFAVASRSVPESDEALQFRREANDATPYNGRRDYDTIGLAHPDLSDLMSHSLAGTGIDSGEMLARVSIGAETEFLERQWVIRDLQSIARTQDIDLATDLNEAMKQLQHVYAELHSDFAEVGALVSTSAHLSNEGPQTEVSNSGDRIPEAIEALLAHYRRGKGTAPVDLRRSGAEAIRTVLTELDYVQVLEGNAENLERFTSDATERLYLVAQVLRNEVEEHGRTDLEMDATRMRLRHRNALRSGYEDDYGW